MDLERFSFPRSSIDFSLDSQTVIFCLTRSAFNLIFCCDSPPHDRSSVTEQQIWRVNFASNLTQLFIYFISSRAQFSFIILTFSLSSLFASTGPAVRPSLVVLAVLVCARLHRSIVLINQWFIGCTFRELVASLHCPKTKPVASLRCPKTKHIFSD